MKSIVDTLERNLYKAIARVIIIDTNFVLFFFVVLLAVGENIYYYFRTLEIYFGTAMVIYLYIGSE